jgi:hypothetical protein
MQSFFVSASVVCGGYLFKKLFYRATEYILYRICTTQHVKTKESIFIIFCIGKQQYEFTLIFSTFTISQLHTVRYCYWAKYFVNG